MSESIADYLLRHAPAAPPNLPQLPLEIWEHIIDHIANLYSSTVFDRFIRKDLRSCALVCRAWVARCRFYLCGRITIRSGEELARIAQWLSNAPQIRSRVRELTAEARDAGADTDPYWVSLIPMRLPKLENLATLTFSGVDLCRRYPNFYKAYSLFRLNKLTFTGVRCSHFSQLARIASLTHATILEVEACIDVGLEKLNVGSTAVASVSHTAGCLNLDRGKLAKANITQRTWAGLSKIVSRGWELSMLSEEFLRIAPNWQEGDESYLKPEYRHIWRDIVTLYQVVCGVRSEFKSKPKEISEQRMRQFRWIAAVTGATLPHYRRELRLEINGGVSPSSVPHLLSLLSPAHFHTVNVYIQQSEFGSWFETWKLIDDALAKPDYSALANVRFYFYQPTFTGLPDGYECEVDLVRELLPQTAERNIIEKCYGDCRYHK